MNKNELYRQIPKVDVLLDMEEIQEMIEEFNRDTVIEAIRIALEHLREFIGKTSNEEQAMAQMNRLVEHIRAQVIRTTEPNMTSVINATGTILHTNLGRAPIGRKHMNHVAEIATGYSNLEYNLEAGCRGERYAHFEDLLCKLTGAEAAMAVNNNAAAVMLILSSLGKGGEVVVSRGELVEIGGKFRIPDVMEQSGATLVEIGTTNKTHLDDYEDAITEETKALLKVHTSNYRIVGFTETVDIADMKKVADEHNLPVIEDLGSGVLIDLSKYGITYEPTVQDSIKKGADVVCFSGDKLLGGPQAGIIIGKKQYIDKMKKNPLTRALRIDKFTATALEMVLKEYLSEEQAIQNIPVLQMITKTIEDVEKDAKSLKRMLSNGKINGALAIEDCESQIGGGSLPLERIPSKAVSIKPNSMTTAEMEEAMRHIPIPIIPRTYDDKIYLDVRTMERGQFAHVVSEIADILGERQ